jgi:hypothetical protein
MAVHAILFRAIAIARAMIGLAVRLLPCVGCISASFELVKAVEQ